MLKNYSTPNGKKERIIKLKQSILVFIISIFVLLSTTTGKAQNNAKSPALETLIEQIDENYVPSGWNDGMNSMEKLAGSIPQIYFTFLGTAMNKQEYYINNNPIASQNYKNLNQEIIFLIPDLVDLKNSKISNNDEPINDRTIGDIYINAKMGDINETFNQNYKKNTGKDLSQIGMPSVLDQHIVGGTSFRKVAKKDKNEINLFGEVAPKAELKNGTNYPRSSDKEPIPEDILVGTWVHESYPAITFSKNNYGYVGIVKYPVSLMEYNVVVKYIITKTYVMTRSEAHVSLIRTRNYKGSYTKKYYPIVNSNNSRNSEQGDANIYIMVGGDNRYYVSSLTTGSLQGYKKQ